MKTKIRWHGVDVPASDYQAVKVIAGLLFRETPTGLNNSEAMKYSVMLACSTLRQVRQHYGTEKIDTVNMKGA